MGGKVGKIIIGGILVVGGVLIGTLGGQPALGFAIAAKGLGVIYNAATGDRALEEQQGIVLENRTGAKQPLPVVYGKTRLGPILADVRVDPASDKRKRLVVVCSFAHGSQDGTGVEAIDEIYLDNALAWTLAGGTQAPYDTNIDDDTDPHQPGEHLKVIVHLGTDSDVVDPILTSLFGTEWPSTAKGLGVCYVVLLLWYNPEIFGGGVPRINAVMRGQKLFDPRDSTTVYSTNPALAIRDFLTSPVYGYGADETEIDDASFEAAADYCDEQVNGGQGSQKRFEVGGWANTGKAIRGSLADLTTACRATVIHVAGLWRIIIRQNQSVSGLVLTPSNTMEGSWRYVLPGSVDAANSSVVQYIDPDKDYQIDSVQWPEPGQTNPLLIDDSDVLHRISLNLPFTDNRLRAQQIAMVLLRESREAIAVILSGKEDLLQAEVGDIVELTHPSPGWVLKPFWVIATNYRPHNGAIDLILVEFEPTVYDVQTQFPQPLISDTNLPNPFVIAAPTSLVLTADNTVALVQPNGDRIPRIRIQWTTADDAYVDYYTVEAKRSGDSLFDTWGEPDHTKTEFFIVPVNEGETWDIRIFAFNMLGKRSTALTGSVVVTSVLGAPLVIEAVPSVTSDGDVNISIAVRDALSVRVAHSLVDFPDKGVVQARVEEVVDSELNTQLLLRNIAGGEQLFISLLAFENADGTGQESINLYKVQSNERELTIFQDEDITDGFSIARNAAAPENGTVVFTADGVGAHCNLEDANTKLTSYRATMIVDWNKNGTLEFFVFVDLEYSTAATGGSWVLADTVVGSAQSGIEEIELVAAVALDADFDLRLSLRYGDVGTDGGKTEVTALGEDSSPPGVQYKKKALRVSATRMVFPVGTDLWEII